jgi:hypothetical protein
VTTCGYLVNALSFDEIERATDYQPSSPSFLPYPLLRQFEILLLFHRRIIVSFQVSTLHGYKPKRKEKKKKKKLSGEFNQLYFWKKYSNPTIISRRRWQPPWDRDNGNGTFSQSLGNSEDSSNQNDS